MTMTCGPKLAGSWDPFVPGGTGVNVHVHVPDTVDWCDVTFLRSSHRSGIVARHVTLATPEMFPFLECAPGLQRITSVGNSRWPEGLRYQP